MNVWGIVPAAGAGTRIQPLAFSKELLPVGSRYEDGAERPRAVTEYLLDRMLAAGISRLCFVVSAGKSDILEYFGASYCGVPIVYVVQPATCGLCDAVFRALPVLGDSDDAVVGLPDTVWFPADGLCRLGDAPLEFLLFPVDQPERFDAVVADESGRVLEIQVKSRAARSRWIWGAFRTRGHVLRELEELWQKRHREDVYLGTLISAWIAGGGVAYAARAGRAYVDVGTVSGYREAVRLLASSPSQHAGSAEAR